MEQQQFEVRRLRHDLANHLQILASLPEEEKDDYLSELLQSPAMESDLHYCGDGTVNAVLNAKASVIEQEGIDFDLKADISEELPFEQVDICALLANAMDNAVEACRKLPGRQRRIEMRLRNRKGIFAVSVSNPLPEGTDVETWGRLPATSKKERENHGYGLKSMEEIAARYGGSMEIKGEDGNFKLLLYMPMEQE